MSGSYRVLWQQKGVLKELRKLGIECVGQWKDLDSRLLPLTSNPECAACGSSAAASAAVLVVLRCCSYTCSYTSEEERFHYIVKYVCSACKVQHRL
jgi:hypothetical protein